MLKRGFELLKTRKQDERIDIDALESTYNFTLPPLYKLFVSTFHLGENCMDFERFYSPEYKDHYAAAEISYSPLADGDEPLDISSFTEIEEVLEKWDKSFKVEPEWEKWGFLFIASIGMGGGLYVGTREENRDKIFRVVWDWDDPYQEICDNIFELVRGLEGTYDPDEVLPGNVTHDRLYKNFGDEYWNVR